MAKRKSPDPLIEALENGQPYTITMADGGNFASMRAVLKHGQTLTFAPVQDYRRVQVDDIVIVKWRGGGYIMHLVGEKQGDQFLIINSLGKENGWTHGRDILGRVIEIIDPEPPPAVPQMLDELEAAYTAVITEVKLAPEDAERLLSVAADMRWYAEIIGVEQWDELPQQNQWSFSQHLWHVMKEAKRAADLPTATFAYRLIHHGKEHVGFIASSLELPEVE